MENTTGVVQRLFPSDSLWRDRSFVLFWLGRAVSLAGTTITTVVLPILIFRLTGSALQTSLLASLSAVPYLVFGLFAGTLADRADRRRVMVVCDFINMTLLASIPITAAFGQLSLWQIYAVALLSATSFVWFDAANFGALPMLVGRAQLVKANSLILTAGTLISIVGPSVGGVLAATMGPANAISFNALTYLLSAAFLLAIPAALSRARAATDQSVSALQIVFSDIREGLTFLWHHPLVRPLTLLGFGSSFTGGAVGGLLVVYGVQALGIPESDPRIGFLFTASAVGALAAGLSLPRLVDHYPVGRITLLGMFVSLPLVMGMALAPSFLVGLALVLLWNASYTLVIINGISLRQMVTPEHLQGRVNATARMIAWGGTPFGATIGGLLAEATDVRTAYMVMALGVGLSAALGWFSPLRHDNMTQI